MTKQPSSFTNIPAPFDLLELCKWFENWQATEELVMTLLKDFPNDIRNWKDDKKLQTRDEAIAQGNNLVDALENQAKFFEEAKKKLPTHLEKLEQLKFAHGKGSWVRYLENLGAQNGLRLEQTHQLLKDLQEGKHISRPQIASEKPGRTRKHELEGRYLSQRMQSNYSIDIFGKSDADQLRQLVFVALTTQSQNQISQSSKIFMVEQLLAPVEYAEELREGMQKLIDTRYLDPKNIDSGDTREYFKKQIAFIDNAQVNPFTKRLMEYAMQFTEDQRGQRKQERIDYKVAARSWPLQRNRLTSLLSDLSVEVKGSATKPPTSDIPKTL